MTTIQYICSTGSQSYLYYNVGALRFNIYQVGGCHGYVQLFYLYRFRSRFYEVVTVMYICSTCIDFVHVFTRLSRLCTFVLLVSISFTFLRGCHGYVHLFYLYRFRSRFYDFSITFLTCGIFCFSFYFKYSNA